jgi:hypothetical protein
MARPKEGEYRSPEIDALDTKMIKMGGKIAQEMEKMNDNPHLTLDAVDLKEVLSMSVEQFSESLHLKGIDFKDPVRLTTPAGTAEAWMHSPQEILDFLRRTEYKN